MAEIATYAVWGIHLNLPSAALVYGPGFVGGAGVAVAVHVGALGGRMRFGGSVLLASAGAAALHRILLLSYGKGPSWVVSAGRLVRDEGWSLVLPSSSPQMARVLGIDSTWLFEVGASSPRRARGSAPTRS